VKRQRKKRAHDTESIGSSSKESIKMAKVGSKGNDVLEWKVVRVFMRPQGLTYTLTD
jgi:hypothetical protein